MYVYVNLNPYKKKTGDCVLRATALALGIDWYEASDMLYRQARSCGCEMSCIGCYSDLFENLGLEKIRAGDNMTVQEVADLYDDKTLLIRISGHLTCAINGRVHDIWDCSDEVVDCYWVIK